MSKQRIVAVQWADDDEPILVRLVWDAGGQLERVEVDGEPVDVAVEHGPGALWLAQVEGRRERFVATAGGPGRLELGVAGDTWTVEVFDERDHWLRAGAGRAGGQSGRVVAAMPGRVVAVRVRVGERVERDQPLVVLEAMKMENDVCAPIAGTVRAVHVEAGQSVAGGDVLVEVEPLQPS